MGPISQEERLMALRVSKRFPPQPCDPDCLLKKPFRASALTGEEMAEKWILARPGT